MLVHKATTAAREVGAKGLCSAAASPPTRSCGCRRWRPASATACAACLPSPAMCTDNAAMIAATGWYRLRSDGPSPLATAAVPNLHLPLSL